MGQRRLTPEERSLWEALASTVRPIKGRRAVPLPSRAIAPADPAARLISVAVPQVRHVPPPRSPAAVLDTSWEKRIRSGALAPDLSIDLHGHSLSAAHMRLDRALTMALAQGARTLLVITGKPRKGEMSSHGSMRGAIRAEIGHWLQTSAHADAIASVRQAHPRHGGEGALYIILRRKK